LEIFGGFLDFETRLKSLPAVWLATGAPLQNGMG
jgi:hypothetical protein